MSQFELDKTNTTLEELELRSRTYGVLKRGGLNLADELLKLSLDDLKGFKNMSRKDLQVLMETLVPSWTGNIHSLLDDSNKKSVPLESLVNTLKQIN